MPVLDFGWSMQGGTVPKGKNIMYLNYGSNT